MFLRGLAYLIVTIGFWFRRFDLQGKVVLFFRMDTTLGPIFATNLSDVPPQVDFGQH